MNQERLPLLMTLLFGGHYQDISSQIIDDFSVTGIIHILSVSGSHMALLFSFLYLLGRWLRLPEKVTAFSVVTLVLCYAAISGFVPPVLRASLMGILTVGGLFFKREGYALNALGVAAIAMILGNPYLVYDVSFQLSFGASAGAFCTLQFSCISYMVRTGKHYCYTAFRTSNYRRIGIYFSAVSFFTSWNRYGICD